MNKKTKQLSRRQLLLNGSSLGIGLLFAPSLLTSCGGRSYQIQDTSVEKATHVLRASSFTGNPDGREREIWGYNGQFPGPEIRAKQGETLRIRVENQLDVPTSVHSHGMRQLGTWQMDGVTGVSREPIPAGDTFTYKFKADPPGTHMYHSHTGMQYSEGLFGPLIIEPDTNPYSYDREEVLFISDWFLESSDVIYENIITGKYMNTAPSTTNVNVQTGDIKIPKDVADVPFQSVLINGKGRQPGDANGPQTTFEIGEGERIRFRIINASSTYSFRLQFDQHPVTVIETDGMPMAPVEVDNLLVDIGERYDVLLEGSKSGTHWIRVVTLDGNEGLAVLRYQKATASEPTKTTVEWGDRLLKPQTMRSPNEVNLETQNLQEFTLEFAGSMSPYAWYINGQQFPDADPIEVKKGETIRFLMKNPTNMNHPFHLHGHHFWVLGKPGELNLKNPVRKDSVSIPSQEDLVIQWVADNPGEWYFHCHIEWHLAIGMGRVIKYQGI